MLDMKHNFLLMDYALNSLRWLWNLKEFNMSLKEYTKYFYKIYIIYGKNAESLKSISKYVNGLSYTIQDEFNVFNFHFVEEAYQEALGIEDKFLKKKYYLRRYLEYVCGHKK